MGDWVSLCLPHFLDGLSMAKLTNNSQESALLDFFADGGWLARCLGYLWFTFNFPNLTTNPKKGLFGFADPTTSPCHYLHFLISKRDTHIEKILDTLCLHPLRILLGRNLLTSSLGHLL